ncbi:MAG: hypothetical protein ACREAC_20180, partial [Blastocatellia bacterium]
VVSVRPDHPHLFAGPDIIVGGQGSLAAIFVPMQREQRNPDRILARLTASRLALPEHTRCLAFLDDRPPLNAATLRNFDEVFYAKDERNLVKFVSDPKALGTFHPFPPEIRNHAYVKYDLCFQVSQLRRRTRRKGSDPRQLMTQLRQAWPAVVPESLFGHKEAFLSVLPPKRRFRDVAFYKSSAIASAGLEGSRSVMELLRPFCEFSLVRSYVLDFGVPYPNPNYPDPNVLLVEQWPTTRLDPMKAVRAAAFAGWVTAAAEEAEEIFELVLRLHETLEKRLK